MKTLLTAIIFFIAFGGCDRDTNYYITNPVPSDSTAVCPTDSIPNERPPFNICELYVINPVGKVIQHYTVSEILEYHSECIVFRTYSGKLKAIKNKKFVLIPCE